MGRRRACSVPSDVMLRIVRLPAAGAAVVVLLLLLFQPFPAPVGAATVEVDPALEQLVYTFAPAGYEPVAEPRVPQGPLSRAEFASALGMTSPLAADVTAVVYVATWQGPNGVVLLTLAASQYSPKLAKDDLAAFSSTYRDRGAGRLSADGADVVAWSSFQPSPLTAVGFARGNRTVVVFAIGDGNSLAAQNYAAELAPQVDALAPPEWSNGALSDTLDSLAYAAGAVLLPVCVAYIVISGIVRRVRRPALTPLAAGAVGPPSYAMRADPTNDLPHLRPPAPPIGWSTPQAPPPPQPPQPSPPTPPAGAHGWPGAPA